MTIETYVDADGRLVEAEVLADVFREVFVGRVVSLSPAKVTVPGRELPVRVHARMVGLTVAVDDFVLLARVEQGVVAIGKVEVI
jgi:hypothetical protein